MPQANDMTCFRLSPEAHNAIREFCVANNTTVSEFYRSITDAVLRGELAPGSGQGYQEARSLAVQLAKILINQATEALPATLDEAIARYGLIG